MAARISGVALNPANGVHFFPAPQQAGPFRVDVDQQALTQFPAIPNGDLNSAMINGDTVVLDYFVTEQNQDNTQPGQYLSSRYDLLAFPQQVGGVPTITGIPGGVAAGPDDLVYYATGRGYLAASEYQAVAK